jgi:hypothetical protein
VQSKPPSALKISMLAPAVMDAMTSQQQDDLCAKILSVSAEMPGAWSSSRDDNDKGTEEALRRLCLAFPEGATFDAEAAGSVGVDSKLSKAEAVAAGEELLRSLKRRRVLETVSDGRHRIVTWVAEMAKRADADSEAAVEAAERHARHVLAWLGWIDRLFDSSEQPVALRMFDADRLSFDAALRMDPIPQALLDSHTELAVYRVLRSRWGLREMLA